MPSREYKIECSHCGNKTLHELEHELTVHEDLESSSGGKMSIEGYYYLIKCRTCEGVSLYSDWELSDNPGYLEEASRLYPVRRDFSSIPEAIKNSYEEAKKVERQSPTAFAVLIRRALEYLCRDKGAKGRDLKAQIDDLASKDIIPKTLARMASALRYLGNTGAHSSDVKIGADEARIIDDFFAAVVEYVYVAPHKLEKLANSLKNKK